MFQKKIFIFFIASIFLLFPLLTIAAFDYTPMEHIPGTPGDPADFCGYIQAVYKFGIWTVGIAAMFMIMFGGYAYMLSAGNNARMKSAKGFIFDALIGIIVAFTAYLLLYIINPDLLRIAYFCNRPAATTPPPPTTITPAATNQGLHPLTSVPLATGCDAYENDFVNASGGNSQLKCLLIAIANQESGCNPNSRSTHGACGMMQLLPTTANMTCDALIQDPAASIQKAADFLASARNTINGYGSTFAIGSENIPGTTTTGNAYGAFLYYTGNDDLIASYNAGPGNNTSGSGKMGPFQTSKDCPTPPTPAWQCPINPGGFLETQKYVMRVQDFQRQCLGTQGGMAPAH